MTEPRQSFETIAGCKVNVRRAGKGEPLLFLHGANGAPHWLPFMEALAGRFEVIVPEHPGFGMSETPDWLDNIADLAFFYLDFMAALGLERVNLVGTSLGGWIAAELAVRNQNPLNTLTLVAPAGIHVKGLQPADIFLWSREQTIRNLVADPALAEKMLSQPLSDEQIDLVLKNNITVARLA
ncbi:MAG TPA: alpha/beta fold hydrolase, partial [Stellaceae bacterium]|nr:alpha/beta fold hydrolase [Stellaceae bacterium]